MKALCVVTVVGARPQFIKAAPVSEALHAAGHREILIHTGQHYDANMSDLFFEQLGMPLPHVNLGVGSGSHGAQTASMLAGVEEVLLQEHPDWLLVYGDTNSTLAGALAAVKLHIPVAHVEAGLRSFNRRMPEEINRVVTDHVSSLLFCPSSVAARNLEVEGITQGVHVVGDVMFDAVLKFSAGIETRSRILTDLGLQPGGYYLATVHRAENTDHRERLDAILQAFRQLDLPVVLPLHPRTRDRLFGGASAPLAQNARWANVLLLEPVGYFDMLMLLKHASVLLTDSGGMQKEAYWLGVPSVTLREETEWVETLQSGWNTLVGTSTERIVSAAKGDRPRAERAALYGDGRAAERIADLLARA